MELPKKLSVALMLTALSLVNTMSAIDATGLGVAVPAISAALNANSVQAYWTGSSFVLGLAVFQPVVAALSDVLGRKITYLASLTLFAVGTIVAGSSQNVAALLVGRTLQGVASAGLISMTYLIISDLFELRQRASALVPISLVWLVGTCIGPIIGGRFSEIGQWRWIFWICLPFAGLGIAIVLPLDNPNQRSKRPVKELKNFDWLGAIIFIGSLTSFLMALSWGGSLFSWTSYHTLVPIILGGVGLIGWLFYENYVPDNPMVPLELLRNRTNAAVFIGTMCLGVVQFGLIYYLPLYYELSKGYSSLIAGVALLAQCALAGPVSALTSVFISKTGRYRIVLWVGWALLSLGTGLLVLLTDRTTVVQWIFINAVSGMGLGCLFTSSSIATQAASDPKYLTMAATLGPFFRAIGQAIGVVIGETIFQNSLQSQLSSSHILLLQQEAHDLSSNLVRLGEILKSLPPGSSQKQEVLALLNPAFHSVWWTFTGFALLAFVLSLIIPQLSTDHIEGSELKREDPEKGLTLTNTPQPTDTHRTESMEPVWIGFVEEDRVTIASEAPLASEPDREEHFPRSI